MKKNKKIIRIIAIVLAALLVGGVVFGALVSALAEEPTPVEDAPRNRCELSMEYLEDEQALHITQRLIYVNPSPKRLESVLLYAAGNLFRRRDTLIYDSKELEKVFFAGYAPAGIDLRDVRCDGKPTDFGLQGEAEAYLRVACDLEPGASCALDFEYYLLLERCGAFIGVGDTDVRLSAFAFIPGVYDARRGEFIVNRPLSYARWLYCDAADYAASLRLPEGDWRLASTGVAERGEDGAWRVEANNVRDFALCFGRRYRGFERRTDSGVALRALTNVRGAGDRALEAAARAVEQCEAWFGPFPFPELELVQSDAPLEAMVFPGLVWLPTDLMSSGRADELAMRIRYAVAQQYFGLSAYVEPSADAWLSDSISEYVACLLLEAEKGRSRFLSYVNRDWVSAIQQTVPGGLNVASDAALFDRYSYDIVVRKRGAVVLHELRLAMGAENLIDGLEGFYRMGQDGRVLTEMDLVSALDAADGGSWEAFLTDWVFNVDRYAGQTMDWYE